MNLIINVFLATSLLSYSCLGTTSPTVSEQKLSNLVICFSVQLIANKINA